MSEQLRWGAATDAGRVRESNEDAYLAEPLVFAVADGMGGHQAGEVASAMAVDVLRQRLIDGAPGVEVVVAAVVEANAAIFQTARRNSAQMGMGTTVTVLAVLPAAEAPEVDESSQAATDAAGVTAEPTVGAEPADSAGPADGVEPAPEPDPTSVAPARAAAAPEPVRLAVANVGDSRTYLVRGGALTRATVDHSYVQELLATGHLSEDEARNHTRRNIVTRALGIEPSVRVDSWVLPLVRGDRFVLCSDGLVDEIDDTQIAEIVRSTDDPQAAAERLVAAALEHGGRDNVTVVVVDVVEGAEPGDDLSAGRTPESTLVMPVVSAAGVAADPITAQPAPARGPSRMPQMTGRLFSALIAVAVVLTAVITLLAVALTGDDAPAPTTTSTTTSSSTTSTTTTVPSPATTVNPEPTASTTATTVGGP
jgi:protein phosphatase